MPNRKKKHRPLQAVFSFNLEDMELETFMWNEDRDPPPLIKPRVKKKEGKHDKN